MLHSRETFLIGNAWVRPASDRRFILIDPSTEEVLGSLPEGVEADIDAAVAAARNALHSGWGDAEPGERAAVMERFGQAIANRSDQLARAVSAQNGMPIAISTPLEGLFPVDVLQYYADLARSIGKPDIRVSPGGRDTLVDRTPVGVVAAIVPWNFPVTLAISKIAPAMAAGCTLVLKPSPGTIFDSCPSSEHLAQMAA